MMLLAFDHAHGVFHKDVMPLQDQYAIHTQLNDSFCELI